MNISVLYIYTGYIFKNVICIYFILFENILLQSMVFHIILFITLFTCVLVLSQTIISELP